MVATAVSLTDAYAAARRGAKLRGERRPRADELGPSARMVWYGDVRRAAVHVMRAEQAELGRLGRACGAGSVEATLSDLTDRAVGSGGALSADQLRQLGEIVDMLGSRLTRDLYLHDAKTYFYVRRLQRFAKLIEDASVSAEANAANRTGCESGYHVQV